MQTCKSSPEGRMDGVRVDTVILCSHHANLHSSPPVQDQSQKRLPNRGKPEEPFLQDSIINRRAFNEVRNVSRGSGTGWSSPRLIRMLFLTSYNL